MAENDVQLELKKRARRRLVGALALALAAVIILPMVMDSKPKPVESELQVRIPGQDSATASRPLVGIPVESDEEVVDDAGGTSRPVATSARSTSSATASQSTPAQSATAATPNRTQAPAQATASSASRPVQTTNTPAPATRPEQHAASKPAATPPARTPAHDSDRALAILDGENVPPATTAQAGKPAEKPAAGKQRYFVQLGAYRDAANVASLQERLKGAGYSAIIEKVGDKTRVRAGPFASREAAEQALGRLKGNGLSGSVVGVN